MLSIATVSHPPGLLRLPKTFSMDSKSYHYEIRHYRDPQDSVDDLAISHLLQWQRTGLYVEERPVYKSHDQNFEPVAIAS